MDLPIPKWAQGETTWNAVLWVCALSPPAFEGARFLIEFRDTTNHSSTDSVGFVFTIPVLLVLYAAGYLIGLATSWSLKALEVGSVHRHSTYVVAIVLPISLAAMAGGIVGGRNASRHNARTAPRFLVTDGQILKTQSNAATCAADSTERSMCMNEETPPKIIGDGKFFIVVSRVEVTVTRAGVTTVPFDHLTNIVGGYATEFSDSNRQHFLAVLVRLGHVPRRAVLLIFDSDAKLLHEEVAETGTSENVSLQACRPDGAASVLVSYGGGQFRYSVRR